ncbi:class I SAM-dependent methyltransferase [Azospirillum brasilense]|uniref:class I SAM-dependent methyltransferase n=1 Tax=Azospirillum brasilense TaxID=192 RepID=UPI001ED9CB4C|nr:class I SAM-dependent methyltransferase [Azospirillum brasilense]
MFARDLADTVSGIDPSAFAALKEVEQRHFWFRTRNRLLTGLINRHFPQARSYLEVGCGNGAVLAEVARLRRWTRLVGSELHPSGLINARERLEPGAEFMQMDARRIPLRSAFELVGAFDVIEHIEEDEAVLTELGAALVPGGGLLLTVPQHPFLWSETDAAAHHVRRYRRGELDAKVRKAGFEILQSTSFLSLLLPLLMTSRLASGRRSSQRAAHTAEFAIAPALNRILGAVTDLEVGLTLRGACWPVGGSRVVIARKTA